MIRDLQDRIIKLKKEKGISILAHSYQGHEILEVADHTGDSYKLSVLATEVLEDTVIMAGVHFMAETVKILSPQKKVLLANPWAGCPMAEQIEPALLAKMKDKNPDYTVVAYINTTAALKTLCDVCVTSSSAVKIVQNIENDKILFIPDCNLGHYVQSQVPEKTFKFVRGRLSRPCSRYPGRCEGGTGEASGCAFAGAPRMRSGRSKRRRLCGVYLRNHGVCA